MTVDVLARPLIAALAVIACLVAGCGGGDDSTSGSTEPAATAETTSTDETAEPTTTTTADPPETSLRPPPCPPVDNCERASGQIAFVERVDPDGDGDAHFILLSTDSITAPGISIIDVRVDLRPSPLPKPGDQLAASGPVFEGSFGQRQIQADAIRFRRAG